MVVFYPRVSPELFETRVFYWLIMDYHASKPHGVNLWTLEVRMNPCFGRGGVSKVRKYMTKKVEREDRDGAAQLVLYHRNQDRDQ